MYSSGGSPPPPPAWSHLMGLRQELALESGLLTPSCSCRSLQFSWNASSTLFPPDQPCASQAWGQFESPTLGLPPSVQSGPQSCDSLPWCCRWSWRKVVCGSFRGGSFYLNLNGLLLSFSPASWPLKPWMAHRPGHHSFLLSRSVRGFQC